MDAEICEHFYREHEGDKKKKKFAFFKTPKNQRAASFYFDAFFIRKNERVFSEYCLLLRNENAKKYVIIICLLQIPV